MGGPNLEVFKVGITTPAITSIYAPLTLCQFGMYIMFPIGVMYYFGTNLDSRFKVPDFWPKEGTTHTIPFEKEDIKEELERLRQRRLANRATAARARGAGCGAQMSRHIKMSRQGIRGRTFWIR